MIVRKRTSSGKWGKPILETSCMDRIGGTLDPVTNNRINCTMQSGRNPGDFVITISRGEYELLKYWFESQ